MFHGYSNSELLIKVRLNNPSIADDSTFNICRQLIDFYQKTDESFFKELASTPLKDRLEYLEILYCACRICINTTDIKFPDWFIQHLWEEQEKERSDLSHKFQCVGTDILTIDPRVIHNQPAQKTCLKIKIPRAVISSLPIQR